MFIRVKKDVTMESKVRVREIWRCYAAGFEDGERGHKSRNAGRAADGNVKAEGERL